MVNRPTPTTGSTATEPQTTAGRVLGIDDDLARRWKMCRNCGHSPGQHGGAVLYSPGKPCLLPRGCDCSGYEPEPAASPSVTEPETPAVPSVDLPERIIVDARGNYWREYPNHYSMCPVSDDNDAIVVLAAYVPEAATAERERLEYGETWERWERFADMAARAGSGFTQDQMTGAAAMLTWLTDHEAEAATAERERAERLLREHEPEPSIVSEPARWDCSCGWHQQPATTQDWWTHVLAALSDPVPTGEPGDE